MRQEFTYKQEDVDAVGKTGINIAGAYRDGIPTLLHRVRHSDALQSCGHDRHLAARTERDPVLVPRKVPWYDSCSFANREPMLVTPGSIRNIGSVNSATIAGVHKPKSNPYFRGSRSLTLQRRSNATILDQ